MKGKVAMEIDLIFKIAGTGIIVAVLNLVLKLLVDQIGTLFERVKSVFGL